MSTIGATPVPTVMDLNANQIANHFESRGGIGFGILDKSVTGIGRTVAFLAKCNAALLLGELVIRGLSNILQGIGLRYEGSWIEKFYERAPTLNIRPYRLISIEEVVIKHEARITSFAQARDFLAQDANQAVKAAYESEVTRHNRHLGWTRLVRDALLSAASGVLLSEGINYLAGSTPRIYNDVLGTFGLQVFDTRYVGAMIDFFSSGSPAPVPVPVPVV